MLAGYNHTWRLVRHDRDAEPTDCGNRGTQDKRGHAQRVAADPVYPCAATWWRRLSGSWRWRGVCECRATPLVCQVPPVYESPEARGASWTAQLTAAGQRRGCGAGRHGQTRTPLAGRRDQQPFALRPRRLRVAPLLPASWLVATNPNGTTQWHNWPAALQDVRVYRAARSRPLGKPPVAHRTITAGAPTWCAYGQRHNGASPDFVGRHVCS